MMNCNICDLRYSSKSKLKRHVNSKHLEIKFPCHECGKKFSDADSVKRHIDSVHKRIVFKCDKTSVIKR